MSHLRLIAADYEAAEAERRQAEADEVSRQARDDIDAFYGKAVDTDNEPEIRYIEALAADIDVHDRYGRPSLLDQIRHNHPTAA